MIWSWKCIALYIITIRCGGRCNMEMSALKSKNISAAWIPICSSLSLTSSGYEKSSFLF